MSLFYNTLKRVYKVRFNGIVMECKLGCSNPRGLQCKFQGSQPLLTVSETLIMTDTHETYTSTHKQTKQPSKNKAHFNQLTHMHLHQHIHIHIHMCRHTQPHTYRHMLLCTHMHTCTHTHRDTEDLNIQCIYRQRQKQTTK